MSVGQPEEIDIAFNLWFNQAQPLSAIVRESLEGPMGQKLAKAVKAQIKHAFVHGFARGVAAEAAQPLPDHPELGGVR